MFMMYRVMFTIPELSLEVGSWKSISAVVLANLASMLILRGQVTSKMGGSTSK